MTGDQGLPISMVFSRMTTIERAIKREEVVRLRVENRLSISEIVKESGISYTSVWKWIKAYPLTKEERLAKISAGWKRYCEKLLQQKIEERSKTSIKKCSECKQDKHVNAFYGNRRTWDGLCGSCKDCINRHRREDKLYTKLKRLEPNQLRFDKRKRSILKERYGISLEDYENMKKEQNGLCLICKNPEDRCIGGKPVGLSVDHDHITGHVRGLLCTRCNLAVGHFEKNRNIIFSILEYLCISFPVCTNLV